MNETARDYTVTKRGLKNQIQERATYNRQQEKTSKATQNRSPRDENKLKVKTLLYHKPRLKPGFEIWTSNSCFQMFQDINLQ